MSSKLNDRKKIDQLLQQWHDGDKEAYDSLFNHLYEDLREIAHRQFRRERPGHSLETDDLVSQFYIKTLASKTIPWKTHLDFLRSAARVMNQIMIDHSRGWNRRADGVGKLPLAQFPEIERERQEFMIKESGPSLLEMESLLQKLAKISPTSALTAELKLVLGLTLEEITNQLELPFHKVSKEWSFAKRFMAEELADSKQRQQGG